MILFYDRAGTTWNDACDMFTTGAMTQAELIAVARDLFDAATFAQILAAIESDE